MTSRPPMLDEAPVSSFFTALGMPLNLVVCPRRPMSSSPSSRPRAVALRPCERLPPSGLCRPLCLLNPGQWLSNLVRGCPHRPLSSSPSSRPQAVALRPCEKLPRRPMSSPPSSRPHAVALRPCERLPPSAYVVASVFSAPGSGYPSQVEVAPAGLCRLRLLDPGH